MKSDPSSPPCPISYFIFLFSNRLLANPPPPPLPTLGTFLSLPLTYRDGRSLGSFHNPGMRAERECVWHTKRQRNPLLTQRLVDPSPCTSPVHPRSPEGTQSQLPTVCVWFKHHQAGPGVLAAPDTQGSPTFCAGTGAAPDEPEAQIPPPHRP